MKMGFFSKFIKSIIDAKSYIYFYKERAARAVGYMFLVCVIFSALISVQLAYSVNKGIGQFEKYFKTEVPEFTLSNGILKTEPNQRKEIGNKEEFPIIIDTTDNANKDELSDYNEGVLILKDKAIFKENSGKQTEYNYSSLGGSTLTKADVEQWIPVAKWINVIIVIGYFIVFTVGKFISALILAVIGLIINGIMKTKFQFGKLYKFGIYALTLPIILMVIETLLRVNIPYFNIIYYGIGVLYMWRGMNAMKLEELASQED